MGAYEIILTPDAISDLTELREYIAGTLSAPDTALKYIQTLRREISTLSDMPARIKAVDEEPWRSRGIRKLLVKNFIVYYRIDEQQKKVYILAVIYGRRDQLRMLSEIDP